MVVIHHKQECAVKAVRLERLVGAAAVSSRSLHHYHRHLDEEEYLTIYLCSRSKTNKRGTDTGSTKEKKEEEEEEEEEGGEGGCQEERANTISERERRRITALTAHTRPWLDPHYGK